MKKILYPLIITSVMAAGSAQAAGPTNSIRGAILVNPVGNVRAVEYEKMFNDRISIGARVGALTYEYDESDYDEDGDGTGAEFLVRVYPGGDGFKGFYFGAAVGYWQTEWDFYETDFPFNYYYGSGETDSINVNVGVGWKIPLGSDRVYIDPSITVGNYFGISDESTYRDRFGIVYTDQAESELGVYVAGGVAIGVNF